MKLICICSYCGSQYGIAQTHTESKNRLMIDFAFCPHCFMPRNIGLFFLKWGQPRCWLCGVPLSLEKNNKYAKTLLHNGCYERLRRIKDATEKQKKGRMVSYG